MDGRDHENPFSIEIDSIDPVFGGVSIPFHPLVDVIKATSWELKSQGKRCVNIKRGKTEIVWYYKTAQY